MPTGIPGLDNMMEGGLPRPSLILLAGDAGAGKTTFCTQFLCKGADLGEHGLCLLTFGGPPDLLFNYASSYEFVKMCGTAHHLGKHAVDISVKGLVVYPGL